MKLSQSGPLVVLAMLAVAAFFAWMTWSKYNSDNPTSTAARIVRDDGGGWFVVAEFPPDVAPSLREGTRAVASSPEFPSVKMSGSIREILPDHSVVIPLDFGPAPGEGPAEAPASVTLDSATAPQP